MVNLDFPNRRTKQFVKKCKNGWILNYDSLNRRTWGCIVAPCAWKHWGSSVVTPLWSVRRQGRQLGAWFRLTVNFINVFRALFSYERPFSRYVLALAPKFCTKNTRVYVDEIDPWGRRKLMIRILIHLSWRAYQFQINKSLCECNLKFYLNILLSMLDRIFCFFALIGPFIQNDLLSCNFLTLVRHWEMTASKWNRTFNQN